MAKEEKKKFWRGLNELNSSDDFKESLAMEFTETEEERHGFSRRQFITSIGATAAFAALAGCANYKDKGHIIPYNKKPEGMVVGNADYYASTCTGCSESCGILIKTREGRPIKIDGNPDHPVNKGKICSKGQLNLLNLYDPERLTKPQFSDRNGSYSDISWTEVTARMVQAFKNAAGGGKEIALITGMITSPALKNILDELVKVYPSAKVYSYESDGNQNFINAFKKSYAVISQPGVELTIPSVKLDEAKVILSVESDFLGTGSNKLDYLRQFSQHREVIDKTDLNKLYCVEGNVTLTGLNADMRQRLRSDKAEEFLLSLLNEFVINKKLSQFAQNSALVNYFKDYSLEAFVTKNNIDKKFISELVNDLKENQGASYVTAGDAMPEGVHTAVNLLNEVLGNTKLFSDSQFFYLQEPSTKDSIIELVNKMKSGSVAAVIHVDTNPVYNFPGELNYEDALSKVEMAVTLTEFSNETSAKSNYILPLHHNYESWGDHRVRTDVISLQQPVIQPLYNTRQKEAILLTLVKQDAQEKLPEDYFMNYLKNSWEKNIFPAAGSGIFFGDFWTNSLHDGAVTLKSKPYSKPQFSVESIFTSTGKIKSPDSFTLLLARSASMGDGRFAGNGYLQELPHPVSKIVWDNYAAISPATAKSSAIDSGDMIEISAGSRKISIPAFVQPGLADNQAVIELGYGRKSAGKIGTGIGVSAYDFISWKENISDRLYNNVKIGKGKGNYELISTMEHYPIDQDRYKDIQFKRGIIRETTLDEYKKEPGVLKENIVVEGLNILTIPSVNEEHKYTGVKWAMSIDLNKCLGCNECVAACNIENNIPVVGKDQVKVKREMHWLRIDRYYSGTPENPKANFMPMLCQHCDFAPCENVCPVGATTHTEEGLNTMAYNRCVGTRYCSNNCPYKVRHFNFFNFRDHVADAYYLKEPVDQLYNPEVTVRSRGVMEKCSFCVQRIMEARQVATEEKRTVKGTDVKTACQEACPADAIYFGDMNDKESPLQKFREHNLAYTVLDELKVKPNITYIAKVRNS